MKFSVGLPTGFEGLMLRIPFGKPEDFVRLGQAAERQGYDSVWGNDHVTTQHYVRALFPDTPPNYYDVFVTLAVVGAATTRLRLGTALLVLPMRDPVWVAKQTATLDQLTGGRFVLGTGIGAYREEFEAWNPRLEGARRGDMADEALELLHRLLTERSVTFTGRYYACRDVEMYPKPRQQPYPIFVGGHNLENVRRAARCGLGWLPGWRPLEELDERIRLLRRQAVEFGRDPDAIEIAPQFSVTVANTMEEAERKYMASGLVAHRKSLAYTGRDLSRQVEANLVGSPDVIREKVAKLAAIGVQHCCALMFPTDDVEEMLEQMQWFGEVVMTARRR